MFTFIDRSGDSVTLRPEGTAGLVRAYLQASLYAKERVSRLFSIGPMFRHERPQKGQVQAVLPGGCRGLRQPRADRGRGAGVDDRPRRSGLGVANYAMEVNSVGCKACREGFRAPSLPSSKTGKRGSARTAWAARQKPIAGIRLQGRAVRPIIAEDAPVLFDYLCPDCRSHFDRFQDHLAKLRVPFIVNKRLVRGLDYYTRTVFEATSQDLGSQKAFAAGGRYDNLVEEMGGPSVPGCGFAIGMERLALIAGKQPEKKCRFISLQPWEMTRGPGSYRSLTHSSWPVCSLPTQSPQAPSSRR